jgi:nicotinate-nucleotide adenylyltransferase
LAQEARFQLGLAGAVLMVTGKAPHKRIEPEPGAKVRLELARRAAEQEPGLEASGREVDRDGLSYTYLTLEQLREEEPDRELFFLLGADMAAGLASWKEPGRVLAAARLGVVPRPGVGLGAVRSALDRFDAADRAEIIEMPLCGISSTIIRERAAAGRPLRHLVPDGVADLIAERGLYR